MRILTARTYLAIVLLIDSSVAISEEFKTINTREGVTVSFVKNTPLKVIKTAAILFAGGEGNISIDVKKKNCWK